MRAEVRHVVLVALLCLGGLACGFVGGLTGQPDAPTATSLPAPTSPPEPTNTPRSTDTIPPPSATPSQESASTGDQETEEAEYDTAFPLPDDVQNFMGEGGDSPINFQTSLTLEEVIAFYRDAFADMELSEYSLLTAIEDEGFSMVFTGWPTGEDVVIQGVAFGDTTNVNIRLEEVVDS